MLTWHWITRPIPCIKIHFFPNGSVHHRDLKNTAEQSNHRITSLSSYYHYSLSNNAFNTCWHALFIDISCNCYIIYVYYVLYTFICVLVFVLLPFWLALYRAPGCTTVYMSLWTLDEDVCDLLFYFWNLTFRLYESSCFMTYWLGPIWFITRYPTWLPSRYTDAILHPVKLWFYIVPYCIYDRFCCCYSFNFALWPIARQSTRLPSRCTDAIHHPGTLWLYITPYCSQSRYLLRRWRQAVVFLFQM